jgi:hypothetical protein
METKKHKKIAAFCICFPKKNAPCYLAKIRHITDLNMGKYTQMRK